MELMLLVLEHYILKDNKMKKCTKQTVKDSRKRSSGVIKTGTPTTKAQMLPDSDKYGKPPKTNGRL